MDIMEGDNIAGNGEIEVVVEIIGGGKEEDKIEFVGIIEGSGGDEGVDVGHE